MVRLCGLGEAFGYFNSGFSSILSPECFAPTGICVTPKPKKPGF